LGRYNLDYLDIAKLAVDAASGKMAEDIVLLDLQELTIIADYFVIASADTARQIDAITESIDSEIKQTFALDPLHIEGAADSGWVLMDYGGMIVHLFSKPQREHYQLEDLWRDARVIVRMA